MAETEQQRRIRLAIDDAIKRRDRYAEDRVSDLLNTLEGAADDVAKQIRRIGRIIRVLRLQAQYRRPPSGMSRSMAGGSLGDAPID
ncbi:MAG: hypothetical protein ABIG68_02305 [Acidobacteriota bacterium]